MISVPAKIQNGIGQRPIITQHSLGAVNINGNAGPTERFGTVFEPFLAFLIHAGFLCEIDHRTAKQSVLFGMNRIVDHPFHRFIIGPSSLPTTKNPVELGKLGNRDC